MIHSLETTHCDLFAQSVGDERESSQISLPELLQLCVHVGAIGRQGTYQPLPSRWRSDIATLLFGTPLERASTSVLLALFLLLFKQSAYPFLTIADFRCIIARLPNYSHDYLAHQVTVNGDSRLAAILGQSQPLIPRPWR